MKEAKRRLAMVSCPSKVNLRNQSIAACGLLVRAALTGFVVAHVSAQDPNSVAVSLSNQSKADLIFDTSHLEANGGKNMWVDHGPFVAAMRYAYEVCASNTLSDITATPVCSRPVAVIWQSNVARSPLSSTLPSDSALGPRGALGKETKAQPGDVCKQGFVWREAVSSDRVCVTPQTRARTLAENQTADQHKLADSDSCKQGYVWRQVLPTDHICVTPQSRAAAADDNRHAAERRTN